MREWSFEFCLLKVGSMLLSSLVGHCFLLNKALRKRPLNVCAEDPLCSPPICVNLSESCLWLSHNLIPDEWHSSLWVLAKHSLRPDGIVLQRDLNAFWSRCTYISIKPFIIIFKNNSSHHKPGSCHCVMYLMGLVLVPITYQIVVLLPVWERELPFCVR